MWRQLYRQTIYCSSIFNAKRAAEVSYDLWGVQFAVTSTPAVSELDRKSMSCVSAVKLYKLIVLSPSLYGCELWYNLRNSDMDMMDVGDRFCLKYIQSIPRRSRGA